MTVEQEHEYVMAHRGTFMGHNGWISKIVTSPIKENVLISASRDKSLLMWELASDSGRFYAKPTRSFNGHNHFISDCSISTDGRHVVSSSWDTTLRIWDIENNCCVTRFTGHTQSVLTVCFSNNNRQIFSGSRDCTIKLWNILGHNKFTFEPEQCHNSWVTSLALSDNPDQQLMASAGYDKTVKVWNCNNGQSVATYVGHTNLVNSVHMSPDGVFLASGGKDGVVNVWNMMTHSFFASAKLNTEIVCVRFQPTATGNLLAVSTANKIYIFNMSETQNGQLVSSIQNIENTEIIDSSNTPADCTTLCWSPSGNMIYAGFTDNCIRLYTLEQINAA